MLVAFDKLDSRFQNDSVKEYYDILKSKSISLMSKRVFDICASLVLIVLLLPVFVVLGVWIKLDSRGEIIFRQTRVTKYGKEFQILKFRTMVKDAPLLGSAVTIGEDPRITKVGRAIRKYRLDELPQLFNVLAGDMSFVGTRPEVPKYVEKYTDEMYATLLMPAGVTSIASIKFKDEEELLTNATDPDYTYVNEVLPKKMVFNLEYIREYSFVEDVAICIKTVIGVL